MNAVYDHETMSLDQALEALFGTLEAMQTVIDLAFLTTTETPADEAAQRVAHLIALFLRPLREAYQAIAENAS